MGMVINQSPLVDGFVKSPAAGLRCNIFVAAHRYVRLTPQFLRAQSRLGGRAFYETSVLITFCEIALVGFFIFRTL
jgi:hypothetical protein